MKYPTITCCKVSNIMKPEDLFLSGITPELNFLFKLFCFTYGVQNLHFITSAFHGLEVMVRQSKLAD